MATAGRFLDPGTYGSRRRGSPVENMLFLLWRSPEVDELCTRVQGCADRPVPHPVMTPVKPPLNPGIH